MAVFLANNDEVLSSGMNKPRILYEVSEILYIIWIIYIQFSNIQYTNFPVHVRETNFTA